MHRLATDDGGLLKSMYVRQTIPWATDREGAKGSNLVRYASEKSQGGED